MNTALSHISQYCQREWLRVKYAGDLSLKDKLDLYPSIVSPNLRKVAVAVYNCLDYVKIGWVTYESVKFKPDIEYGEKQAFHM